MIRSCRHRTTRLNGFLCRIPCTTARRLDHGGRHMILIELNRANSVRLGGWCWNHWRIRIVVVVGRIIHGPIGFLLWRDTVGMGRDWLLRWWLDSSCIGGRRRWRWWARSFVVIGIGHCGSVGELWVVSIVVWRVVVIVVDHVVMNCIILGYNEKRGGGVSCGWWWRWWRRSIDPLLVG